VSAIPLFTLLVIAGLLLAEARLSSRHDAALRARGALAPPGDVYRSMTIVYPAAFLVMGIEGMWRAASAQWGNGLGFYAAGLLLFVASKGLKYWAIAALGERWSFRVLVLPGAPLVTSGPYRYVAHPNYLAVLGELVGTAMMMEAWFSGPIFLLIFGALLWMRVGVETEALRQASEKNE
jgi:methyltransferase